MDLYPHNRFVGAIAFAHRFQISRIFEQHRVAVHAGFGGRNSGLRGDFHAAVTIAAVDAVVTGMMFVAELDGLVASDVLAGVIRSAREHQDAGKSQRRRQNSKEKTESSDGICAAVKNLGHVNFVRECGNVPNGQRLPERPQLYPGSACPGPLTR